MSEVVMGRPNATARPGCLAGGLAEGDDVLVEALDRVRSGNRAGWFLPRLLAGPDASPAWVLALRARVDRCEGGARSERRTRRCAVVDAEERSRSTLRNQQ